MAKKNGLSSADLYQQLVDSLPAAESAVVESAVTFVNDGPDLDELKAAVANLNAIRAAEKAMSKVVKSSKPAVATDPEAAPGIHSASQRKPAVAWFHESETQKETQDP
jgi:hypothetical protein